MLDQRLLALAVAEVHPSDLRDRDVALVHDHEPVVLAPARHVAEVVEQRVRPATRCAAFHVARIVLDAPAGPGLGDHLEVVLRAAEQALRLEQLALRLQLEHLGIELGLDRGHGAVELVLRGHVVHGREDERAIELVEQLARDGVERLDPVDLVAEGLDPQGHLLVGGEDLDAVAADAEVAALGRHVVACVLHVGQAQQERPPVERHAALQHEHGLHVLVWRTQAVEARHARDHDRVGAREQVARRRQPQPVQVLVPRGILLDEDVPLRDVCLGLVVVVVAHEVAHRVVREELAHLLVELRGERLVVAHDQRGALRARDHVGHGEGLAGAGRTEQRLEAITRRQAAQELLDRLRLVPGGRKRAHELEATLHAGKGTPLGLTRRVQPPAARVRGDA